MDDISPTPLKSSRRGRDPAYIDAHLVGIAGSGMRALAAVLLGQGWQLSGSDANVGAVAELAGQGVRLYGGHAAEHVSPQVRLVVRSDAVPDDNSEIRRAAELGIRIHSYFEMVGQIMDAGRGLAVAGTHGKSTTTAMAAHILTHVGLDPTVFCGATPLGATSGGRAGDNNRAEGAPLVLTEACEYRANFLHLRPQMAVILGIEPDHFDCFPTTDDLHAAFARFVDRLPNAGLLLARHDCPTTRTVAARAMCRVETFGVDQPSADWSAQLAACRRGCYEFWVKWGGSRVARVALSVPGRHNVVNALAAMALACRAGAMPSQAAEALAGFCGLQRRLEMRGTFGGVTVVDDYAHHPTEVTATLAAVRQCFPGRRVWCVFQPHQVSRTTRLLDELAASLQNAEKVVVTEIFRAREAPPRDGEITAVDLAAAARAHGVDVPSVHQREAIDRLLAREIVPGDVLITMGAGDIGRICNGFIDRFREHRAAG